MTTNNQIPNPGSNEALELGCLCPVLDNARGIGYMGVPGNWVIVQGCPLHSPVKVEKESDRP